MPGNAVSVSSKKRRISSFPRLTRDWTGYLDRLVRVASGADAGPDPFTGR